MTSRPLNIAQIWPHSLRAVGGVESHISALVDQLLLRGHHVEVLKSADSLGTVPWDIVHTHGDKFDEALVGCRRGQGYHWVHTLHGVSFDRMKACGEWLSLGGWRATWREGLMASGAHGVIAVSDLVAEGARRYFQTPEQKMFIIPGGTRSSSPESVAKRERPLDGRPYVVFVGRGEDPVKNVPFLVSAWEDLKRQNRFCRILQGSLLVLIPSIPNSLERVGLDVIQTGELSVDEVGYWINHASALAIPSLYESDSLVAWDAAAVGTPILSGHQVGAYRSLMRQAPSYPWTVCGSLKHWQNAMKESLLSSSGRELKRIRFERSWMDMAVEVEGVYWGLKGEDLLKSQKSHCAS